MLPLPRMETQQPEGDGGNAEAGEIGEDREIMGEDEEVGCPRILERGDLIQMKRMIQRTRMMIVGT